MRTKWSRSWSTFDVRAWYRECAERGLILDQFAVPSVGEDTDVIGSIHGRPVVVQLSRGLATCWITMVCSERGGHRFTVIDWDAETPMSTIVAAIVRLAPDRLCNGCRSALAADGVADRAHAG